MVCFGSLSCCRIQSRPKSEITNWWGKILSQYLLVVIWIHNSFNVRKIFSSWGSKTPPHHNTSLTMFYCGQKVLFKGCFGFSPNIAPLVVTNKLNFCFICPQNFLPVVESLVQVVFANFNLASRRLVFKSGFFLETLPCRPGSMSSVLWTGEHECQLW